MWTLRSGWVASRGPDGIDVTADVISFRIKIDSGSIDSFFPGGEFGIDPENPDPLHEAVLEKLKSLGLVSNLHSASAPWLPSLQSQYYFHLGLDPERAGENLQNSRVLILGLGGTGSIILDHLASAGVGRFVLLDYDKVEPSNLERQLIYRRDSIGKLKTDEARRHVLSKHPHAEVECLSEEIFDAAGFEDILQRAGEVVACVVCIDQPPDRAFKMTSEVLWRRNVPFLHGGVMIRSGFWGPFFSAPNGSRAPGAFCIWEETGPSSPAAVPLKICFSPYNTIVAAHMSAELLHFLTGAHSMVDFERRTFIDFRENSLKKIRAEELVRHA